MATPLSLAGPGADLPDFPADAIEVGRIVGAWGVKGGFKVQPHASDAQALFSSRRWFLQPPAGPQHEMPSLLRITGVRGQSASVVATAQEVGDRDGAQALAGARVFVSRSSFPTAGEGEYYWVDLIGLEVVNRDGVALGEVTDLIDTGVHSVLCVRRRDAPADVGERLIPFVAAYIDDVDLDARRIRVDWGLDY
jgi:16S rRNA processing protein RimM